MENRMGSLSLRLCALKSSQVYFNFWQLKSLYFACGTDLAEPRGNLPSSSSPVSLEQHVTSNPRAVLNLSGCH